MTGRLMTKIAGKAAVEAGVSKERTINLVQSGAHVAFHFSIIIVVDISRLLNFNSKIVTNRIL